MEKNNKLYTLYSKLDVFGLVDEHNKSVKVRAKKAVFPLFIKTNESYEKADKKIMIFGQETNRWGGIYGTGITVEEILDKYENFFNTKCCYSYAGQFWNGVKHFINSYKKKNSDISVDYLWNNIVKMGIDNKGFPYAFYENIVKPNLNQLINKEIEILKPDNIIFFTGPNYDEIIDDVFNKPDRIEIQGYTKRELCEIKITNVKKAIRTYHPNYLYRNDIDKYYKTIIKEFMK